MTQSVLVRLELPSDWKRFRLPRALHERLQELLDRQDLKGGLSPRERREARALAELVDILTQIRVRAKLANSTDVD